MSPNILTFLLFKAFLSVLSFIFECICYSVNHYKPLQTRLLQNCYKPLKTITNRYKPVTPRTVMNRYKPLQTVTNQSLRKPLWTVTKSYKPSQTVYSINCYKPLHYQYDTTGYLLVQLRHSRVTTVDTLSQWLFGFNIEQYKSPL